MGLGDVAQLAEHLLCKERVRSSSLLVSTTLLVGRPPHPDAIAPLIRDLPEATDQRTAGESFGSRDPPTRIAPYQLDNVIGKREVFLIFDFAVLSRNSDIDPICP